MISPLSATAAASIAAAALVAAGAALAGSYHTLRGLVPIVTCPRVIRYVGSCLPLRAGSGGLHVAQGGLAHRHRPLCIAPDGLHVAQGGGGATICLRSFSCVPLASS